MRGKGKYNIAQHQVICTFIKRFKIDTSTNLRVLISEDCILEIHLHKQVRIQIRKLYFDLVYFKVQSYWKIPFLKTEIQKMYIVRHLLARKNMDLNVHEGQSITQSKVKEHGFYFCCFTFHGHSSVFTYEHQSYHRISVKRSLAQ